MYTSKQATLTQHSYKITHRLNIDVTGEKNRTCVPIDTSPLSKTSILLNKQLYNIKFT
jgi:hypothetical protein